MLAALSAGQRQHRRCLDVLSRWEGPLLLSPFVLAELDYLIVKLAGVSAEVLLLEEVAREAYRLVPFGARDVAEAREVIEQYASLGIGLADASLVVLARRHSTEAVLTLDERHFRVLPGPRGRPFTLYPSNPL